MKAIVVILHSNYEVEYDFHITSHGCQSNGWDEPGYGAEFDIEILSISYVGLEQVNLDIPEWLRDLLATHLTERDDINTIVQEADQDNSNDDDY